MHVALSPLRCCLPYVQGLVRMFVEVEKYERKGGGEDDEERFNHHALTYARAAAACRACPYEIQSTPRDKAVQVDISLNLG